MNNFLYFNHFTIFTGANKIISCGNMFQLEKLCFGVGLILTFVFFVDTQLCTERQTFMRWVPETYIRSYKETYQGNCWYRCTKTRWRSYIDQRMVPKHVVENKDVCCAGYMEDDTSLQLKCNPICRPTCKNGYCKSPSQCACNEGYEIDRDNPHNCLPICHKSCGHGTCIRPDVCDCNFGYTFTNSTCQAICTEACVNGTCVAPDTCECFNGYRKTESNLCLPYCSNGCPHGTCVAPENCTCNDGWYKDSSDDCVPRCDISCGGGYCIAPNVCECDTGYEKTHNGTCIPTCTKECLHGICAAPENCVCDDRWHKNETGDCVPICDIDCGVGGTCVEPDVCECETGYGKNLNGTCVPHCFNGCPNGTCVSPEVCECNEGWNKTHLGICEPYCNSGCVFGTCIEPDVCRCHIGYKINMDNMNDSLCIPECKNCSGICVAPENCIDISATTTEVAFTECNDSSCIDKKDSTISMTETSDYVKTSDEKAEVTVPTIDEARHINNDAIYQKQSIWSNYWIYIAVTAVAVTLLAFILLIVKRKAVARMCHGGVRENEACHSIQRDMSYLKMMHKEQN
nr:neurogenic locus protein delta-like isoform X2 [Vanessa tameamea]XP_026489162.1 neurogenic locus protein delta-like isoform X2 [Vanessa tameamea]